MLPSAASRACSFSSALSRSKNLISIPPPLGRLISLMLKRSISPSAGKICSSGAYSSRTASCISPKARCLKPSVYSCRMLFFFRLPIGSPPAKGRRTEKAPFTYTHENRRVIDERLYKKKKVGKKYRLFLLPCSVLSVLGLAHHLQRIHRLLVHGGNQVQVGRLFRLKRYGAQGA